MVFPTAEVAELADAQASGACPRKGVEVQILSSAPFDSVASLPRSWQATRYRTEANGVLGERSESKGIPFRSYSLARGKPSRLGRPRRRLSRHSNAPSSVGSKRCEGGPPNISKTFGNPLAGSPFV